MLNVLGVFSIVRIWTKCLHVSGSSLREKVSPGLSKWCQEHVQNLFMISWPSLWVQEPWNQNQWLCTGSRRPEKDLEVFVRVSDWLSSQCMSQWLCHLHWSSLRIRKHCEKLSYKNCWTVCLWEQPAAAAERSSRFFHQPLWFLWKEEESYLMVRSKNSRDGLWRVNTDGSDGSQDPMIRTTDTRSRVQVRVKQLELYCIYSLNCWSNYIISCFFSPLLWLVGSGTFSLNGTMMSL